MHTLPPEPIGQALAHFQAALEREGSSLAEFIEARYVRRWTSDTLYHVLAVRTSFVAGMQDFLMAKGLLNLERVQLSLLTDPRLHGVFVDSPNIRLESAATDGAQRGKYLIDFSQLDVEVRRNRGIDLDTYFGRPAWVAELLREDHHAARRFFEGMIRAGVARVLERNEADLEGLGVVLELPAAEFPVFHLSDALRRHDAAQVEQALGERTRAPFFWISGLMRENYDLVYPYLRPDGTRRPLAGIDSREIFNFDLCAKSTLRGSGHQSAAREILSGALREWLPEPITARLLDNGILPTAPAFRDGRLENLAELGGYGPFLTVVHRRDAAGRATFPDTYGAGVGVERALWALLRGPAVENIEDVTCFGKNPDSHPLYLF